MIGTDEIVLHGTGVYVLFRWTRADLYAAGDDSGQELRVGLVADFEDVLAGYVLEAREGGLKVVERIAHVAIGGEDDRLEPRGIRWHALVLWQAGRQASRQASRGM